MLGSPPNGMSIRFGFLGRGATWAAHPLSASCAGLGDSVPRRFSPRTTEWINNFEPGPAATSPHAAGARQEESKRAKQQQTVGGGRTPMPSWPPQPPPPSFQLPMQPQDPRLTRQGSGLAPLQQQLLFPSAASPSGQLLMDLQRLPGSGGAESNPPSTGGGGSWLGDLALQQQAAAATALAAQLAAFGRQPHQPQRKSSKRDTEASLPPAPATLARAYCEDLPPSLGVSAGARQEPAGDTDSLGLPHWGQQPRAQHEWALGQQRSSRSCRAGQLPGPPSGSSCRQPSCAPGSCRSDRRPGWYPSCQPCWRPGPCGFRSPAEPRHAAAAGSANDPQDPCRIRLPAGCSQGRLPATANGIPAAAADAASLVCTPGGPCYPLCRPGPVPSADRPGSHVDWGRWDPLPGPLRP